MADTEIRDPRDAGGARDTSGLPLLPLQSGAVFPQMVVTLALETDEARRAGSAAEAAGGRIMLVPRVDGRFARVGTVAVEQRLELVLEWARDVLADLELKERIRTDVTDNLEAQQREMLLRRQLDAIRKELGEGEDDEIGQYRERVGASKMPDAVRNAVERELDRLERMGPQNPENQWVRTWLDTMLELPWGEYATERDD